MDKFSYIFFVVFISTIVSEISCEDLAIKGRWGRETVLVDQNLALSCGEFHSVQSPSLSPEEKEYSANKGEMPWVVALFFSNGQYVVAGSLIHVRVIASVTFRGSINITKAEAGRWNLTATEHTSQTRDIEKVVPYNSPLRGLALYIVKTPFKITPTVNIICLSHSVFDIDIEKCVSAGWGYLTHKRELSGVLKKIPMKLLERDECQDADGTIIMSKDEICATSQSNQDLCQGDSGGPLSCPLQENGPLTLLGITSYGRKCGGRFPNYFVDIAYLSGWISEFLSDYK